MTKPRRLATLGLVLTLTLSALAAPASAIYFGDDRSAGHDAGAVSWIDQLWSRFVAMFAADNGNIVPRP